MTTPALTPRPGDQLASTVCTTRVVVVRFPADRSPLIECGGGLMVAAAPGAKHGPLLALLALDLPRVHAPDATLKSFEYRLVRPAFAPATVVVAGQPPHDGIVELAVSAAGAQPSLTATAVIA